MKNVDCEIKTVLSNTALHGVIRQTDYFEKGIANVENIDTYYIVEPDDFVYNPLVSSLAPYGPIHANELRESGIVSPLYTVFRINDSDEISYDYIKYFFESAQWHKYMYTVANYGARHDRMNIIDEDFFNLPVILPPYKEQQKIAEILNHCDKVIALKQQLIEEERKRKKWLMKNLLDPDSGVRLCGFESNEWDNARIGEIMEITSCKRVHESDWTDSGVPFYRAREIVALHEKQCINPLHISHELYESFSALCGKVRVGDLLVTGDGTIGVPYLISKNEALYFKDGNIIWFKNRGAIDNLYFYYAFDGEYIQKQIRDMAGIGTVGTYTIEGAKKTKIFLPSCDEQKSIAETLYIADWKTELIRNELTQWQQKKKALMQLLLTGLVRVAT